MRQVEVLGVSHARHASKRARQGATVTQSQNNKSQSALDPVDACLEQVNRDGFVQPKTRLERINSKVNARVPKDMICVVCSERQTEVRTLQLLLIA